MNTNQLFSIMFFYRMASRKNEKQIGSQVDTHEQITKKILGDQFDYRFVFYSFLICWSDLSSPLQWTFNILLLIFHIFFACFLI